MAAFKRRAPLTEEAAGEVPTQADQMSPNESKTNEARTIKYMQYIKALNSQFSSWIQQQLDEHPCQLWQEGVQDYLRHASKILEDFKDVISADSSINKETGSVLKVTTNSQIFSSHSGDKNYSFDASAAGKPNALFSQPFSLSSPFMPSTSSAFPVLNIPTTTANNLPNNGDEAQDEDDIPPEPSSPSVKRSEEKGIKVIHEVKCRLYIKAEQNSEKAWIELGSGTVTIKAKEGTKPGSKDAKATIIVRNEVGRIQLNALLYSDIKMIVNKNSVSGFFHSAETDLKPQDKDNQESEVTKLKMYLFKLKSASDAEKLSEVITSNAPKVE